VKLKPHSNSERPSGPVVLVVMDGVGLGCGDEGDAVAQAKTPNLDALSGSASFRSLRAHGKAVGLPSDSDMGNSEVGHNAMGAGRIITQGALLVNKAIESGAIYDSQAWQKIISRSTATPTREEAPVDFTSTLRGQEVPPQSPKGAQRAQPSEGAPVDFTSTLRGQERPQKSGTIHFIGLLSDGNVHSHEQHLHAMLKRAHSSGVRSVCVHVLLDGRDVSESSALTYVDRLEMILKSLTDDHHDYRVVSGGGRMKVTMDRYEADWSVVECGWNAQVHGQGRGFASARQAIEQIREETNGVIDQYLPPFVIHRNGEAAGKMKDGDSVVFYNFRGDRALEISQAFDEGENFDKFDRGKKPEIFYVGMTCYDGDYGIPKNYLVVPPSIDRTMSEYLVATGLTQFAISETQKFGHMTYFWNGNRRDKFDEAKEVYVEIPSDNLPFNEAPEMKAKEITERTIEAIRSGEYDFLRLNYANGDMVGHTGDLAATIRAVEVVDAQLAVIRAEVEAKHGILLVTADHGNADEMFERDKAGIAKRSENGKRMAKTSHTLAPVGFWIYPSCALRQDLPDAGLANIAATVLQLLGYEAPDDYEPSLLTPE
jgi:2,3-bisphosphoglycerate-independent phosphoglycerate mutase